MLTDHRWRHLPARVVQVTVVVAPADNGSQLSYTAWADPRAPGVRELKKEELVSCELRPVTIPAVEAFWVVRSCEPLV